MSYATRLSKLDQQYADATGVGPLPVGKHEVEITKSHVTEASWGDLVWELVYLNADGAFTDRINLENPKVLWKVKRTAKLLGGPEDRLSQLAQWAPVAVGAKVFIEVTESPNKDPEKDPYKNAAVVKLLSEGKGEALKEEPGPAPQSDLDDIPFAPTFLDSFM